MHRAVLYDDFEKPLRVGTVPTKQPSRGELLIRIHYAGICHSDLHHWMGDFSAIYRPPMPHSGGHEGAGEVVAVGEGVDDWTVGDHAGITWVNGMCGFCDRCRTGKDQHCAKSVNLGFIRDGTFQEYIVLAARDAVRIPKHADLALVTSVMCAGITAYGALKKSGAAAGQWIVMTGAAGGLGSYGIQYANIMGLRVIAIDMRSKRDHCLECGAEEFVAADDEPMAIVKRVTEITNGGAPVVINFATSKVAAEVAMLYTRPGGTVVLVGVPKDDAMTLSMTLACARDLTVTGSLIGNRLHLDEAVDFAARGLIKVPVEKIAMSDVAKVFNRMHDGHQKSRSVIDFSL